MAASACLLAGCGGSDDPGTTTAPVEPAAISRTEFLRQANEICFSTRTQIEAAVDDLVVGREGLREAEPKETARVVTRVVVPALESNVEAICAIGAPEGDEGEIARILETTRRGIAELRTDPAGVLDRPPPALRDAGRLARDYGAERCGFDRAALGA